MALLDRQTIKPGQPITARILNEFVRARELFGMLAVGPGLRKELRGRQITLGLQQGIGSGGGGTLSDSNPEKHNSTASPGTSDEGARIDHVHPGRPYYEADTKANLSNTSIEANAEGYATSTNRSYRRNDANDDWISTTHLEN